MHTIRNAAESATDEMHPDKSAVSLDEERQARARAGYFWDDAPARGQSDFVLARDAHLDPHADKSGIVHIARSFLSHLAQEAERVNPIKLGDPITEDEWWHARSSQPPIVDRWFYEDVGCFVAPGGTGKTTLLLFQVIHIVLGRMLFGYDVLAAGPVIILTAEDSRETLVARLRQMCIQMQLTDAEIRTVREDVIVTDVSGLGIKLTAVERDVVMPSAQLDRLIVEVGFRNPSLLIIDPMVSFGVGESRINDAEQGMIDAARRIRNTARCGIIYVHHTGKDNARNKTTDQYSGRGGSALADGCRMVHVLQRLTPDDWTQATGDVLERDDSGFVLARPKMTWCAPQPDLYLKRHGYTFSRYDHVDGSEGAKRVHQLADEKVFQFLRNEYEKGTKHTQNTAEEARVLTQKATRDAIRRLLKDGRLIKEDFGTGGRGGARHYLRPMDLPMTT